MVNLLTTEVVTPLILMFHLSHFKILYIDTFAYLKVICIFKISFNPSFHSFIYLHYFSYTYMYNHESIKFRYFNQSLPCNMKIKTLLPYFLPTAPKLRTNWPYNCYQCIPCAILCMPSSKIMFELPVVFRIVWLQGRNVARLTCTKSLQLATRGAVGMEG